MEKSVKDFLVKAGLAFVNIPTGTYTVGVEKDKTQLLALPPQWQFDFFNDWVFAKQDIKTFEFCISREPLCLSHWEKIIKHPKAENILVESISRESLAYTESHIVTTDTVEIEPTAGERQLAFAAEEEIHYKKLPCQQNPDPVLEITAEEVHKLINALNRIYSCDIRIPNWFEWEIAVRGKEAFLYPWGNNMDIKKLSIEQQDYSVDEESTMGYYSYDQYVYFIHSFGPYTNITSPFNLTHLARAGREWNLHNNDSTIKQNMQLFTKNGFSNYILRSFSDLGSMTFRIPGIRNNTVGWGSAFNKNKHYCAFSGPLASCYALPRVGKKNSIWKKPLFQRAGIRFVIKQ